MAADANRVGLLAKYEALIEQSQVVLEKFASKNDEFVRIRQNNPRATELFLKLECGQYVYTLDDQARAIVDSFNADKLEASRILKSHIPEITKSDSSPKLRQVIIESKRIVRGLGSSLSDAEISQLVEFRQELNAVCADLEPDLEKNLLESINSIEKGEFLGSALVSSRVIEYLVNEPELQSLSEKIKKLTADGKIAKDSADIQTAIVVANKTARNYFSHRIHVYASYSDAVSLLAGAIKILKIYRLLLIG